MNNSQLLSKQSDTTEHNGTPHMHTSFSLHKLLFSVVMTRIICAGMKKQRKKEGGRQLMH